MRGFFGLLYAIHGRRLCILREPEHLTPLSLREVLAILAALVGADILEFVAVGEVLRFTMPQSHAEGR